MNISILVNTFVLLLGLFFVNYTHAQQEIPSKELTEKVKEASDFSSFWGGLKKFGSDMAKTVAPDQLEKDSSTISDAAKKSLNQTKNDYVELWGLLTGKGDATKETESSESNLMDIKEIVNTVKIAISSNLSEFPKIAIAVLDMNDEWKPMSAHEYSTPGLIAQQEQGIPILVSKLGNGCIKIAVVIWETIVVKKSQMIGQYCAKDIQANKLPGVWQNSIGNSYSEAEKRDGIFEKSNPRQNQYVNNTMIFGRSKGAFLLGAFMDEMLARQIDPFSKPSYPAYENTKRMWLEAVLIKGGAYNNGY